MSEATDMQTALPLGPAVEAAIAMREAEARVALEHQQVRAQPGIEATLLVEMLGREICLWVDGQANGRASMADVVAHLMEVDLVVTGGRGGATVAMIALGELLQHPHGLRFVDGTWMESTPLMMVEES